jgi:hypothetical protein
MKARTRRMSVVNKQYTLTVCVCIAILILLSIDTPSLSLGDQSRGDGGVSSDEEELI